MNFVFLDPTLSPTFRATSFWNVFRSLGLVVQLSKHRPWIHEMLYFRAHNFVGVAAICRV